MTWLEDGAGLTGRAREVRRRAMSSLAGNRLALRLFVSRQSAVDMACYRLSGGRLTLASFGTGLPVLLLHTVGARSGRLRTVPLLVAPHQGGFLAVGSNYGNPRNPAWVHNLRAHPRILASLKGVDAQVQARELTGAERDDAFAVAAEIYPGWANHVRLAAPRILPVFHITRVNAGLNLRTEAPGGRGLNSRTEAPGGRH